MTTGTLDDFGRIAIVVAVLYVPVLILSVILVLRHGFKRDAGWIFLAIFSTIRVIGGCSMVAAELIRPINTNVYIVAFIMEAAGLSPLLMATLGFLRTVGSGSFSESNTTTQMWRLLGLLGTIALALSIYGGSNANSSNASTVHSANNYRHIGSLLFGLLYLLLAGVHVVCWMRASTLMRNRRTLLVAISTALPFLGIRMLYGILSSYSGSLISTPGTPNTSSLARFNMATGDWRLYLIMSVLMEAISTIIYVTAGTRIPLQEDFAGKESIGLYGQNAYAPPAPAYYASNDGGRYVAPYRA